MVVNAYALTFGRLLLGGRAGDLLGRRKMFIAGLLLFSPPRWSVGSPPRRLSCSPPARCGASAARSSPRRRCR
jgi:MFS family permease